MAGDKGRIGNLPVLLILFFMFFILSGCFPLGNYLELSMNVSDINNRIENLEQKINQKSPSKNPEISELQRTVSNLQTSIQTLQTNVENVKKISNIAEDYLTLEKNVSSINNQIEEISKKITDLEKSAYSLSSKTTSAENKIQELETKFSFKIGAIESKIQEIQATSTTSGTSLIQFTKKIDDMDKITTQISSKINTLESKIQELQTNITTSNSSMIQLTKKLGDLEKVTNSTASKILNVENQLKEIENVKKELDLVNMRLRNLQDGISFNLIQNDTLFLKQLQQQIQEIKAAIQSLSPEELLRLKSGYIYYVVKQGDNLSSIANAYNVKLNDLTSINNISDTSKIYVGQVIKIPVGEPSQYVRTPVKIVPSDIITYFGQNKNGITSIGIDIYARGKDIYPILPGKVLSIDNNTVRIDHGNMIVAVYGGVNTSVKPGSFISNTKPLGQCIDVFHFELYIEGEPRDPLRLFTEYKGIFTVTFYTEWDDGKVPSHPTFRIARNGGVPEQFKTIAVDPNVIPLGSLVYIPTLNNTIFIAEDTGSAIKGNRIDVYVSDVRMALNNGVSPHPVYIIYPEKNVQ
ncbi:MAG: 3D domain-containing protein [Fervidobacterium sp.]